MRSMVQASMEEEVVLPWVPAQASVFFPRPSSASICERCHTCMPASRAQASSGFFSGMADEMTTMSVSAGRLDASCPMKTSTPACTSCLVLRDSFMSEPETW